MTGLQLYIDFLVFAFGAVVGSFLNVCIHRMPLDQSIVFPPSHCPHCDQRIRWADNIPLFSYLALRCKCRNCGAKISPRYFIVELLTAVLFLLMWLKLTQWDDPPVHGIYFLKAPIYWMVIAGLIVATFIDFEHYIIPNEITLGGIVVGLLLSIVYPPLMGANSLQMSVVRSVLGVLVGGVTLLVVATVGEIIFKKEAMGMGDVKFLAAIGAFFGWQATLFTVFVSSMLGGVIGLILVIGSKKGWQSRIPYGPYIALGALLWMYCGREIMKWYLGFIQG
ncbi:MAG TPA: prepilin peptidase [Verrucomicrobiae bacterium]|nr:prepilin peptidase [Verrucomicrobiae bacterium]